MKRLLFFLAAMVMTAAAAWCSDWCEVLVGKLQKQQDVKSAIAIYRDSDTHGIIRATYEFKFSSGAICDMVLREMRANSVTSEYFAEKGDKKKEVIMRFIHDGRKWSCRLRPLGGGQNQFLVNVSVEGKADNVPVPVPEAPARKVKRTKNVSPATSEAVEKNNSEIREAEKERRRRLSF